MAYKLSVIKIQEHMHKELRKNNKQKCSAHWGCLSLTVPKNSCCHVWKLKNIQEELNLNYGHLRWGPWASDDSLSAAIPSVFPQSHLLMSPGDGCVGNLDHHSENVFSETVSMSFSGRVFKPLGDEHCRLATTQKLIRSCPGWWDVGSIMQP